MIAKCARFFFLCLAFLPYLWWRAFAILIGKTKAFQGMSQLCSLIPGKTGELFRAAFYRLSFKHTSQRTSIAFLSTFSNPHAVIEEHVSIGAYCNIGWAHIQKNSILSSHVCITSGKNDHSIDDIHTPIRLQKGKSEKVTIGQNCWIGIGVTIMADIGEGSVIAAGSVVTKPVPPYSIVAGVPAKVIRSRLNEEEQKSITSQKKTLRKPVVLQLLTTLNMGGAERIAISILDNKKDNFSGVVGAIYGETGDLATLANSLNIPTFNLRIESCGRIKAIWKLYKMLREYNIDIIHTHAAYLLNFALPAAILARVPLVFTEHSVFELQQMPKLRRAIRFSAPFLGGISCISQPIADYFINELAISSKHVIIIENGIDTEQFSPKNNTNKTSPLPWQEERDSIFVFGTVARLCMEKDHPNMLHAFACIKEKYPQARLLLVGDGAERENTVKLIKELNLVDSVHITGKALDIPERLRSLDVFVMSSEHEGLPMSILEAMACKIPVISTDAGDIANLNSSGENLMLVPKKNHHALAEAMEKMLLDSLLRKSYADRAHKFVREEKSAKKMSEMYHSLFIEAGLSS